MQIGGRAKWARMEGVGYRRPSAYRPECGSLPWPLKAEDVPFASPLPYRHGQSGSGRGRTGAELCRGRRVAGAQAVSRDALNDSLSFGLALAAE
jgi:hypothetical protein